MNTFQTTEAKDLVSKFSTLGREGYKLTLYKDDLNRPCGKLERVSKRSKLGIKLVKHGWADTEEKILDFFSKKYDEILANINAKAKRNETLKIVREKQANSVKEGDMFYSSWGYDQTNIDFYVVVKKTSATGVVLQQVGCDVVKTVDWCSYNVKINKNKPIGLPFRKKLSGNSVHLKSYITASKFEDANKVFYCDHSKH